MAENIEPEPFTMEGEELDRVAALTKELLAACKVAAEVQLAGKELRPEKSIPDATILGRTIISMTVQSILAAREEAGISAFDGVDGLAHGIGTVLAQVTPTGADAFRSLLVANIDGYEQRTRAAFNSRKGPLHG